jgi:hypothetical protein
VLEGRETHVREAALNIVYSFNSSPPPLPPPARAYTHTLHVLSLTIVPSNSVVSLECFGVSFRAALGEFE